MSNPDESFDFKNELALLETRITTLKMLTLTLAGYAYGVGSHHSDDKTRTAQRALIELQRALRELETAYDILDGYDIPF